MQKYLESNILLSKCIRKAIDLCLAIIVSSDFIKLNHILAVLGHSFTLLSCDVTVYLLTCFVVFEDHQFVMKCTIFPKERFPPVQFSSFAVL